MSPSSIVLEPSDKPLERSVKFTADDGPFRVTKVTGDLLSAPVEVPAGAASRHDLRLWLDPARVVSGGVSLVVIGTDHQFQPELSLRVLILPSPRN